MDAERERLTAREANEYGFVRYVLYEDYVIRDGRLWHQGDVRDKYVPMLHPELPNEIAKLRRGDTKAVLRFAREFGLLGYWHVAERDEGEPLDWIWMHAYTIRTCFDLIDLLCKNDEPALATYLSTLTESLAMGIRQIPGDGNREVFLERYTPHPGLSITANAKQLRRDIVNWNTGPISRFFLETNDKVERLYYRLDGVIRMAYWHLGTFFIEGAHRLVRCKDPKCQAWVTQRDPRQHFCPVRPGVKAKESRCSARYRMRTRRADQQRQHQE